MEQIKIGILKKVWAWIKSVWCIGSNIVKFLNGQDEIKERLTKIEEAIKSPQYQLAELEKIKTTIDLLKENNEQEKKKLERGSQEEIDKHKTRVAELTAINEELHQYKGLVVKEIEIITQKDSEIKELNAQIKQLKKNAPSALSLAFLASLSAQQDLSGEWPGSLLDEDVLGKTKNDTKYPWMV
ncbi:MAG: hypothetical protein WC532_01455 [Candidatus Omnitrophota bacterium]